MISYEPQQPMDERIYSSYGAAQARAADRDFALKAGAQAQQAAHQSSALAQQDEHFIEQQRQQSQLAYAQMGHQENMQDAQQTAAMRLQQNRQNFEFTQADNLRLQRLNQDAAGWEQLHSSGEITDQEFAQGQQMVARQQMPLQARQQATEQHHRERAQKIQDEESAMAATRFNRESAFHARSLSERTQNLFDPEIEAEVRSQLDPDGSVANMNVPGFEEAVHAEVTRRGGATKVFESQPGTFTPLDSRRAADQEARRHHISQGIQRVDDAISRELDKWADPVKAPNAPAWTRTEAGIATERTRRIDQVQGDIERIFNPGGNSQSARPAAAPGATPAARPAVTPAGTAIPNTEVAPPPLAVINEPSDFTGTRVRAVENIANAIVPRRGQTGQATGPIENATQFGLAERMRNMLNTASRENRTLTNNEATEYERIRRDLGQLNPEAGAMLDLNRTKEQDSFGHTEARRNELRQLVPALHTEARRFADNRSLFGDNRGANLARQLATILEPASTRNRSLSADETSRYLRTLRELRGVNRDWANRLALHQDFNAR